MEFERSIFRMHERLLLQRSCPKIAKIVQRVSCALFIYLLLAFVIYHKLYVNDSEILSNAMEVQLLASGSGQEHRKLPYSEEKDRYVFCNIKTFQASDKESLVEQAIETKTETKEEATEKSTEELITELNFVPCDFYRDELFSVVVINDVTVAEELKRLNQMQNLTSDILKKDYANEVDTWYYFSNQAPILYFANNEWRDKHNITENLIILSIYDLEPSNFLRPFMGWQLDIDLIMVNQFMFTFRRENGYLLNNSTSETWLWHEKRFGRTLMNPKHDLDNEYFFWFCFVLVYKTLRIVGAVFGFMLLSFVNGLIVRIALMCSNVVIFPMLYFMKLFSG